MIVAVSLGQERDFDLEVNECASGETVFVKNSSRRFFCVGRTPVPIASMKIQRAGGVEINGQGEITRSGVKSWGVRNPGPSHFEQYEDLDEAAARRTLARARSQELWRI